jgi:hypothetical protein
MDDPPVNNSEGSTDHPIPDLIIEFAEIAFNDPQICELLRRQDEIAEDDAILASEIQSQVTIKLAGFLRDKGFPHTLISQTKMAFTLVKLRMKGELTTFESKEARDVIVDEFGKYPSFYGVK